MTKAEFHFECQRFDEKFGECWKDDTMVDDIVAASGKKYRIKSFFNTENGYQTLVYWYDEGYKCYTRVGDLSGMDVHTSLEAMRNGHKAMVNYWKKK